VPDLNLWNITELSAFSNHRSHPAAKVSHITFIPLTLYLQKMISIFRLGGFEWAMGNQKILLSGFHSVTN